MQEINTIDCYKLATNLLIEYFGWWTINEWKGVYTHDDGTIVIENTLLCSVCTDKNIDKFIQDAKRIFNQESILVQKINSDVKFL
jgi:hypothetical protein